jgi:glycosyltransferase involved in cell wall biosynthesis
MTRLAHGRRILIGVTIDDSLQFHIGLPAALVKDGWDVHVVSGPGRRIDALVAVDGITTHVLPMHREPSLVHDVRALIRWITLIRRVRPDVTLIGTPKAALLGNIAGRLCRVPRRIYNLLGLRVETATGLLRRVLLAMERSTVRGSTEVLAVSKSVKHQAHALGLAPEEKVVVLGEGSCNGVDVDRYRTIAMDEAQRRDLQAEFSVDTTIPVIGFVGRLTRDKGLSELAGALRLLAEQDCEVQLLVVGGVDDESGLAALNQLKMTGQRIVATGYQPDPAPFYALMDVFCLPSLREGLPNVILEAMASGTLVVASDATGNIDLVQNGVTGLLVSRGSATELAVALQNGIRRDSDTELMASNALGRVASFYDTVDVQARIRSFLGEESVGEWSRDHSEQ